MTNEPAHRHFETMIIATCILRLKGCLYLRNPLTLRDLFPGLKFIPFTDSPTPNVPDEFQLSLNGPIQKSIEYLLLQLNRPEQYQTLLKDRDEEGKIELAFIGQKGWDVIDTRFGIRTGKMTTCKVVLLIQAKHYSGDVPAEDYAVWIKTSIDVAQSLPNVNVISIIISTKPLQQQEKLTGSIDVKMAEASAGSLLKKRVDFYQITSSDSLDQFALFGSRYLFEH